MVTAVSSLKAVTRASEIILFLSKSRGFIADVSLWHRSASSCGISQPSTFRSSPVGSPSRGNNCYHLGLVGDIFRILSKNGLFIADVCHSYTLNDASAIRSGIEKRSFSIADAYVNHKTYMPELCHTDRKTAQG